MGGGLHQGRAYGGEEQRARGNSGSADVQGQVGEVSPPDLEGERSRRTKRPREEGKMRFEP